MVYVAVGSCEEPFALSRVLVEVGLHVSMHQFLKVHVSRVTKCPDYDIGAHALAPWYVTVWIINLSIVGNIVCCHANLRASGEDDVNIVGMDFYNCPIGHDAFFAVAFKN